MNSRSSSSDDDDGGGVPAMSKRDAKRAKKRNRRKRKREQLERENEELREQLEQKDEQLKQKDEQLEQKDELLEQTQEESDIRAGNFYSTIDEVWGTEGKRLDKERSWSTLRREKCPTFRARSATSVKNGYELTRDGAYQTDFIAMTSQSSVSSSTSPMEIWPTDIFGNKHLGQLAHLVPSSPRDASMYTDVALCALGDSTNPPWGVLQRMIHGSKTDETSRRLPHTGIKHLLPNRIRLVGQAEYLDREPGIVVVPVMSLEALKNWNGGAYDAVVMVGEVGKISAVQVCRVVQMNVLPEENNEELKRPSVPFNVRYSIATEEQVEMARLLLEDVLFGLADSFLYHLPGLMGNGTPEQREAFEELQGNFTFGSKLIVPTIAKSDPKQPLQVRLVSFEEQNPSSYSPPYKHHPAPDPLFLAVRAGVNFSARHGQRLKAAAEPQPDDVDRDELYDLAVEQHFEFWAAQCRPPENPDEFARRLGEGGGLVA